MTVITLSRQYGSGGEEVATRVCTELGLVAFDKRLMMRVAKEVGIGEDEIVDYTEDQYKSRGFFDALFRRSRPVAELSSWMGGRGAQGYERQVRVMDEAGAIALVRSAINAAYERGRVLILGRGGQAILEDKPNVLHVRIAAPFESRVEKVQADEKLTAAQARRQIAQRDRARAEYLSTFHHIDVDDPSLYHMVLNSAKLGVDKCVEIIKAAAVGLA